MVTVYFILLLLALVCFVASAVNVATPRVSLLALGFAFWVAVPFIQTLQRL